MDITKEDIEQLQSKYQCSITSIHFPEISANDFAISRIIKNDPEPLLDGKYQDVTIEYFGDEPHKYNIVIQEFEFIPYSRLVPMLECAQERVNRAIKYNELLEY